MHEPMTRNGAAVVGVLEVDDADVEAWALGSNPEFLATIERSRDRSRREGSVPMEEVRRRLGIPRSPTSTNDCTTDSPPAEPP